MPQQFILKGHHIEVKYTIGITPGAIALTYKDESASHDFKTDEITTEKTRLGSLISVALVKSVDIGGTNFGFFLPDVPAGQAFDFTTTLYARNSAVLTRFHIVQPSGIVFRCTAR